MDQTSLDSTNCASVYRLMIFCLVNNRMLYDFGDCNSLASILKALDKKNHYDNGQEKKDCNRFNSLFLKRVYIFTV